MPPKIEDQAEAPAAEVAIEEFVEVAAPADRAAIEPEAEAPAAEVSGEAVAPAADTGPVTEITPELAELNSGLIAMCHPDGGTCDLYGTDAAGNILVPADQAGSMIEHGFVVAGDA